MQQYFDDCVSTGCTFALGGQIDNADGWFVPVTLGTTRRRIRGWWPRSRAALFFRYCVRRANDTVWGLGATVWGLGATVWGLGATVWGLGATVWGADLEAIERIGKQLEAGTAWLDEVHQHSPHQVFGAHEQSGIGAENALPGLADYTNPRPSPSTRRRAPFHRERES